MTIAKLNRILKENNIPEDAILMSDSGWEYCASDMDGVYYRAEDNTVVFTQDYSNNFYNSRPDWKKLELKEESEERNMQTLYVVTADGYDDGYGSELYLLGVFKDKESAKALEEKYSHLEVTITAIELGKTYPLSPNERGWGLTYENDNYLGGYVE